MNTSLEEARDASIDDARLHATTERRRVELDLANKSKDVFLSMLSHELRTPLNAIVGWIDMMKSASLSGQELTRAIEIIDRNAHALSKVVADLLDVSGIVTGMLKLESTLVSLRSIVESAVLAARSQCGSKNIDIALEIEQGCGAVVGDARGLRQVMANLLSNAVKFTPFGGTVSVRIVSAEPDRVRVIVADTGEGIAPEFLPHVFERFRQERPGRAKGLGLGLAIVKHLVEAHGGTVTAASGGHGKGATFILELPVVADSSAVLDDENEPARPPDGEPDLNGIHVLIVEDDPDGNELICSILERYGARVTSATTAAAALSALETGEHPDLLVSDIGLPDMDGTALIKTVRETETLASIPAIALTAYASQQDAIKAVAAGFDAHVPKPVRPSMLGTLMMRLLDPAGENGSSLATSKERSFPMPVL